MMVHKLSLLLTKKITENRYSIIGIESQKICYAIEAMIEELKLNIILLVMFGVKGKLDEILVCMTTLTLLRRWVGGTHMKSSIGCIAMTYIFYYMAIIGLSNLDIGRYIPIVFVLYWLICFLIAPLPSRNRPRLRKKQRARIKKRAIGGISTVMVMYLCLINYRCCIGNVATLQLVDVVFAIIINQVDINGGKK